MSGVKEARYICVHPFPCDRGWYAPGQELCAMCSRVLAHDDIHWNGAFYQCVDCARLEALDPDQDGRDPIFGGYDPDAGGPLYKTGGSA